MDFHEAYRKTHRKYELLEEKETLESELKLLDAEVHKLRIIAHNEQAEADNLESPSLKGFLLGLAGKKQERLEKEQAEARTAKQNYEHAKVRHESVMQKLAACDAELSELASCDDVLCRFLQLPEDPKLLTLTQCQTDLLQLQEHISALIGTLAKVSQLGAARNGSAATSALAGTDDKLLAMERRAQDLLEQLKTDLLHFQECLAPYEITVNSDKLHRIADDYLLNLYTYALIADRVEKITIILRHIGFELNAVKPKLLQTASEHYKKHLQTILNMAAEASK